jgi:hypothetical protein
VIRCEYKSVEYPHYVLTEKSANFYLGNLKGKYHLGDIYKRNDVIKGVLKEIGWEGVGEIGPVGVLVRKDVELLIP